MARTLRRPRQPHRIKKTLHKAKTHMARACQCVGCPRGAAEESPFCPKHTRDGCPAGSPLSGYEPPYEPELWNVDKAIQYSHNCFAYATNYIDWQKVETCRTTEGCNANGWWSHKPGGRPVTNLDAAGVRIYNPERCSRYYPKENAEDTGLNYRHFCCFLAIPRGTAAAFIKLAGGQLRNQRLSKKKASKRTHKK